jgi:hypothetical protein
MWALIVNGRVHEITDVDPDGRFAPDLTWVPCDSSVREGWVYDGEAFVARDQSQPQMPSAPLTLSAEALFFERMTDGEYQELDAGIKAGESARVYRGWAGAVLFVEDTDMWKLLEKHLSEIVSPERKAYLLGLGN